jgi:hypothetical protein
MRAVTKPEFKSTYFRYGSVATGWTVDYWESCYEPVNDMTWCVAYPEAATHSRMFIMKDFANHEIRTVFLTEESEESFLVKEATIKIKPCSAHWVLHTNVIGHL